MYNLVRKQIAHPKICLHHKIKESNKKSHFLKGTLGNPSYQDGLEVNIIANKTSPLLPHHMIPVKTFPFQ
jgi:hypothetical protein